MYDDLQALGTACFQNFIFLIKILPQNILKNELLSRVYVCVCARTHMLSHVRLSVTPRTRDLQALLTVGFPRQEYRCEKPFPFPGYIPDPRTKLTSPASTALVDRFFTTEPLGSP